MKRAARLDKVTKRRAVPELVPAPRDVVAPPALARLVAPSESGWRVQLGSKERLAAVDPSLDPALLEEALTLGARVVVEGQDDLLIVGVLSTQRSLRVDRSNAVDAVLRRFSVSVEEKALLRAPGSFIQITSQEVELYAERVLTRAREVARILATLIRLN